MAPIQEMQRLVAGLEAAFSARTAAELDRQETAASDARERAGVASERHAAAMDDARERLAQIAGLRVEVSQTLGGFRQQEVFTALQDARERAAAEQERRTAAAQDARERAAADQERRTAAAQDARERAGVASERHAAAMDDARERVDTQREVGRVWRDHAGTDDGGGGKRGKSSPRPRRAPAERRARQPRPAAVTVPVPAEPPAEPPGAGSGAEPAESAEPAKAGHASPEEIYAYLAEHPDGVKLAELEGHFHSPRIVMAQSIHEMIKNKQVRRDERTRLYFAA